MASAKKISAQKAKELAKSIGINFSKDVSEQNISAMSQLSAIAKLKGYKKPKIASGSTSRYFFTYLKKIK